jgi:hypothetical protein
MAGLRFRASAALAVLTFISNCAPTGAHAYFKQYHFYVTYTLGDFCGLNDAEVIAWADYYTDVYPGCSPGVHPGEWTDPAKIGDRRIFHFRTSEPKGEVIRASKEARALLDEILSSKENDPVHFGISLHPFQDSWAHEGFGPVIGHTLHGTKPDLPHNDVPKAMQMAEATWIALDQWSVRTKGAPCALGWTTVAQLIESLSTKRLRDGEAIEAFWAGEVKDFAKRELHPDDLNESEHQPRFVARVAELKKKYGEPQDKSKRIATSVFEQ